MNDKRLWSPSDFGVKRLTYTKTKENMYAFTPENIVFVLHFIMNSYKLSSELFSVRSFSWMRMCAIRGLLKETLDASFKDNPFKRPSDWDSLQRWLMTRYAAMLSFVKFETHYASTWVQTLLATLTWFCVPLRSKRTYTLQVCAVEDVWVNSSSSSKTLN